MTMPKRRRADRRAHEGIDAKLTHHQFEGDGSLPTVTVACNPTSQSEPLIHLSSLFHLAPISHAATAFTGRVQLLRRPVIGAIDFTLS